MKKSKKTLSFLTAAAMLCGVTMPAEPLAQIGAVLTARAANATSGMCGENLTWEYDAATKTLTISGTGETGNYDFLEPPPWWPYKDAITSVNIEDGVTFIDSGTFSGCSMTSVKIPGSVTDIGNGSFMRCPYLVSLSISDGVTRIGQMTFGECTSLTSVTIPASVTIIDIYAFEGCSALTSIIIENPDCEIYDKASTICNEFVDDNSTFTGTIYGYENSTAQAYAEKYGYNFDTIDHAPVSASMLGDVSGDNVINAGDAAMTLSTAAVYGATGSYGDMTEAQITAADIDGNGMVNASDAAYILQYAAIKGANGKEFDIRELVK